jgi:hypothetical protein
MTELATLTEAMCQGTATTADRDRLEALLRDPANRAQFLAASRLHSELLWRWHRGRISLVYPSREIESASAAGREARPAVASVPSPGRRGARRIAASVAAMRESVVAWLRFFSRPAPLAYLVAVIMLASLLGVAGVLRIGAVDQSGFASSVRKQPPIVARITGLHQVRWQSRQTARQDWDALPVGARLEVAAGLVQVTYLTGANVVIEGPAVYEASGPSSGRLVRGRIAARTEHEKRPEPIDPASKELPPLFTVRTPTRLVHDLGTEFGVEVSDSGDAGVHVFEGLVELASVGPPAAADEVPIRLGVGESAGIDEAGRINTSRVTLARRFVRSLPKPKQPRGVPEWDDAIAEVIYRDNFNGSGPLHGTAPGSRNGVGGIAWEAKPASWGVMETADGTPRLAAAGGGGASLPFTPEPGCLYKLSVGLNVTSGEGSWAAAGFIDPAAPFTESDPLNYAWFAQRHRNFPTLAPPYDFNMHCVGPGRTPRLRGDPFVGEQKRAILLDTSSPRWSVQFLVGDRVVGRHVYAANPTGIRRIGIGTELAVTGATFRSFVLKRIHVASETHELKVETAVKENK